MEQSIAIDNRSFVKDSIPYYVGLFTNDYEKTISEVKSPKSFTINKISHSMANSFVFEHHYLHRRLYIARNVSYGLFAKDFCVGVCMFGYPVWREYPELVPPLSVNETPELLRLCTMKGLPKNTESYFTSRCMKKMLNDWEKETGTKPKCITSFCDNAMGFSGALYKSLNFSFLRTTKGRSSNPCGTHGKWQKNSQKQDSEKTMYVYYFNR
jgi:hypothetical protein